MRALLRTLKEYKDWETPRLLGEDDPSSVILTNDLQGLIAVPPKFWNLCQQVMTFRQQRPTNLPVSIRRLHSWNLNSWYPDAITNAHKSGIIRSLLHTAPVLLQETKWTEVQLQHLLHAWPDVKVTTTFAKQDTNPQAGVAILIPAGWELSSHKVLVEHYAVAARVDFQACSVWLVSLCVPPKSPKALVDQIFQALLTLETHPVFIGGDFNRCDQHHPQVWQDFLGQLGATDIDSTFPTYRFGEQQESPLDRFLVPSFFLDTAQLHVRVTGRYRVSTCHHKTITALLTMKPRLIPHPHSEKHCTIPTKVFLDPTAFAVGEVEAKRQQALHLLRRNVSLVQESCATNIPLSIHARALVWSWWRNSSKVFKHISPLTKLYKRLGKGQPVLHINRDVLRHLYEQSGLIELLQPWPQQHNQSLVPAEVVATALQSAEIATTSLAHLPLGQEHTDPARRARRQRLFWDRLKTICPRGTFYHGPLLQKDGKECKTAQEYDEAMLATRTFWFQPPIRYDPAWAPTLATYRTHTEPWPEVPEPIAEDYIEHLLLTKDSAPGPDGLPYAFWRMFPEQSAAFLQDDFDRMMSCELPAPTQVGVWIPKAKQGPTADFFRPLGMPDTLDRLQDGTAAAILFRTTRHCFHPAQTMLNAFREPQRAVLEVQRTLEGEIPASALFADLSKAFERVNAYWILQVLHIRRCSRWILQLAKYLLFGRRIRHKVQGRLLPPRDVFSGVDMGRSTSVFFFCLAMDPIFVALNQVPRVLLVAGYVDDTTIVGTQRDPEWIKEVFALASTWSTAGVIMDAHTCWQVGLSRISLPEQQLLRLADYADAFIPWHEQGEATISAAIRHIPHYAHYFVLRHGEHCAMFHTSQLQDWLKTGCVMDTPYFFGLRLVPVTADRKPSY